MESSVSPYKRAEESLRLFEQGSHRLAHKPTGENRQSNIPNGVGNRALGAMQISAPQPRLTVLPLMQSKALTMPA